jgi:alpha-galactosidase
MLAAPLIAGNDIRKMSEATKNILTNKEVIAVDQDKLGIEGFVYKIKDSVEIYVKPLSENNWAICFLNRSAETKNIDFNWQDEIINDTLFNRTLDAKKVTYKLRDLWKKANLDDTKKPLKANIHSHDVLILKVSL